MLRYSLRGPLLADSLSAHPFSRGAAAAMLATKLAPAVGAPVLPGNATATATATGAATTSSSASASTKSPQQQQQRGERREHRSFRKPLSERFDIHGHPHPSLNPNYASLLVGEHFGRLVFDRRTEMIAILSATNLIRETIAGQGRILLMSHDKRLQGDILAAGRDTGEFVHSGKWPPGGFTNRPQVSVVPQLPSLVIAFEPDNHVLMREAFRMCIPRVAPVDATNVKADFQPEVPLHAAEYTIHEKKRMLHFFASFIAKLKFGQMPVGDTQGRFKEFIGKMSDVYVKNARDIPEPYVRAATRPHDSRPDLKFGIKPVHVAYNAHRAMEESNQYRILALQPDSYMDAASTEDDFNYRDPSIDTLNLSETVEMSSLTRGSQTVPSVDGSGLYIRDQNNELIPEENGRDFEYEELHAELRARREAGVSTKMQWNHTNNLPEDTEVVRRAKEIERGIGRVADNDLREQYEAFLQAKQDHTNEFIPHNDEDETSVSKLSSKFRNPTERAAQERMWKLKQRVRQANQEQQQADKEAKEQEEEHFRRTIRRPEAKHIDTRGTVERMLSQQKREYSTMTTMRRSFSTSNTTTTPSTASTSEPTAAAESSTSASPASSSSSTPPPPKFQFPRFLLPLFLLAPALAYYLTLQHADSDELAKLKEQQKGELSKVKSALGLAPAQAKEQTQSTQAQQAVTSPPSSHHRRLSDRTLSVVRRELSMLLEARTFIYDSIPPEDRTKHAGILDEIEEMRVELEAEIVRLEATTDAKH